MESTNGHAYDLFFSCGEDGDHCLIQCAEYIEGVKHPNKDYRYQVNISDCENRIF